MNILNTLIKSGMVDKLAGQFGLDKRQVENVIRKGLPTITKQIGKNTLDQEGSDKFSDALKDHRDRDVEGMINDSDKINTTEGGKILDHIFGKKKADVEDEISKEEDVSKEKVSSILKIIAPIVMVILAKRAFSGNKDDDDKTIIQREEKKSKPGNLKSFFDTDGDGQIFDDVLDNLFGKK